MKDKPKARLLHKAIEKEKLDELRELLSQGLSADLTAPDGRTPLMTALMFGQKDAAKLLLEHGADVNARGPAGDSVLHFAATFSPGAIRLLLKAGADVKAVNDEGESALMVTSSVKGATALLEGGADPNHHRNDGLGLLDLCEIAVDSGVEEMRKEAKLVDLLRAHGAVPVDRNDLLQNAAAEGKLTRLRELLADGEDIDGADLRGYTAVMAAVMEGQLEAFRLLQEAGADLKKIHPRDGDLLTLAAAGGQPAIVRELLAAGYPVHGAGPRSGVGEIPTPLFLAAAEGHVDVVRLLLEHGAPVDVGWMDPRQTALVAAAAGGHDAIVEILRQAGATVHPFVVGDHDHDCGHDHDHDHDCAVDHDHDTDDEDEDEDFEDEDDEDDDDEDGEEVDFTDFVTVSRSREYRELVKELATFTDGPPKELGYDRKTEWEAPPGIFRCVFRKLDRFAELVEDLPDEIRKSRRKKAEAVLVGIVQRVRDAGFLLVMDGLPESDKTHKMLLFPTGDKYRVVSARDTSAPGQAISNADVIAWLRRLETDLGQPFDLTAVGGDCLAGAFESDVRDPAGLAQELVDFCPQLLADDGMSPAHLAEMLVESPGFFLWWND